MNTISQGSPPPTQSAKRNRVSLWLTIAMAATIGLVVWATRDNGIPKGPQPPFSVLADELARIGPFTGSVSTQEPEKQVKIGSEMISARYSLTMPSLQARTYYRDELSRNGWRYRRTLSSSSNWVDVYCKGSLQGSVELVPASSAPPVLALSISWNAISVHECQ